MTVYLLLLIAVYSFLASTDFASLTVERFNTSYQQVFASHPKWYLPVLATCEALLVTALVAVLLWRRIGVYIFCAASLAAGAADYYAQEIPQAAFIVTAMIVFLVLLWIGSPRSTWSQLD